MQSYTVFGAKKGLEKIVEEHNITVQYKAKYVPLIQIVSDRPYEELKEMFSEYTVSQPKEYHTQNDTK